MVAQIASTLLYRVDVVEESYEEFYNQLKSELNKILNSEYNYILRILFFLNNIYEIRLIKYKNKLYLIHDLNYINKNILNSYDILIETYKVPVFALKYHIEREYMQFEEIYEENIDNIILIIKNIIIINLFKQNKKDKNDELVVTASGSSTNISVLNSKIKYKEKYVINKNIYLNNNYIDKIIYKLLNISYDLDKFDNIINIINKYGIVAFGKNDEYVIIFLGKKYNIKECSYVIIKIKGKTISQILCENSKKRISELYARAIEAEASLVI